MSYELLTRIEFLLFVVAAYSCRKDPLLYKVASLFALIHFFNMFYNPEGIGPVSFLLESIICAALGFIATNKSLRAWSLSIGIIMVSSISLTLFEFIDYAINASKLTETWLVWIHIITAFEVLIFLAASNGYLQFYGDGPRGGHIYRDSQRSNWVGLVHSAEAKEA